MAIAEDANPSPVPERRATSGEVRVEPVPFSGRIIPRGGEIIPCSRRHPNAGGGGSLIGRKSGPRQAYSLTLTTSILAVLALDCLLTIFGFPVSRYSAMYYPGGGWWTLLTYPLAADPLGLVLAGFWLYLAGNDIEARWGRRCYGLFLAISVPLCSLPLFLGASFFHYPFWRNCTWDFLNRRPRTRPRPW